MRPHGVVVLAPCLDDDLGFTAGAEPLDAQALVPEPAVEVYKFGNSPTVGSSERMSLLR